MSLTWSLATDIKEQIDKFKQERIGGKRRDFVETVKTEAGGNADGEAANTPANPENTGGEPMALDP